MSGVTGRVLHTRPKKKGGNRKTITETNFVRAHKGKRLKKKTQFADEQREGGEGATEKPNFYRLCLVFEENKITGKKRPAQEKKKPIGRVEKERREKERKEKTALLGRRRRRG